MSNPDAITEVRRENGGGQSNAEPVSPMSNHDANPFNVRID